jgi:hypothetical protein
VDLIILAQIAAPPSLPLVMQSSFSYPFPTKWDQHNMFFIMLIKIRIWVNPTLVKLKIKNSLFSLGIVTYSYESQDVIQFVIKRLPGGWRCNCRSCYCNTILTRHTYTEISLNHSLHTYHSRLIPEGVAEASQIFLRDAHVLPKLHSYVEHCSRDKW